MEYEFPLSKPLIQRARPDYSIRPSAEQRALVRWITPQVLRLLTGYVLLTGQNSLFASGAPFHLFVLNDQLCSMLGLDSGCVVLIDLLEVVPKLVWSDADLGALQRMPLDQLRISCRQLGTTRPNVYAFSLLTASGAID